MKLRLFFAVNFEESVRKRFYSISVQLQKFNEQVKYEPIEKLHLTLLFLGNVEETLIPQLSSQVHKISTQFSETELIFDKLGVFKNFKQPRVIWIGSKENVILDNLSKELKRVANEFGIITDDKEFSPHITLGRVKGNLSQKFIEHLKNFKFEPFSASVKSFELMESILEPSGSKYFIKESFNLNKGKTF